jgi:hypothetical protein
MNTIKNTTSRLVRIVGLLTAVIAVLALTAQSAFAHVAPVDPAAAQGAAPTPIATPAIITHTSGGGLATWAVLLIAVGAIIVGVALTELGHVASRRYRSQRLEAARAY